MSAVGDSFSLRSTTPRIATITTLDQRYGARHDNDRTSDCGDVKRNIFDAKLGEDRRHGRSQRRKECPELPMSC